MTLSDLAFEHAHPRDGLSIKQVGLYDLWEHLHRLAWNVCMDPSPRVLDQLIILHELTNPDYRRDPIAGASALEKVLDINKNCTSYERHLGPAVTALMRYASACGQRREYVESEAESESPSGTSNENPEHIGSGGHTTVPAGTLLR